MTSFGCALAPLYREVKRLWPWPAGWETLS